MTHRTYKVRCCVPGCKRSGSFLEPHDECICQKHYALVDKKLKRLRQKMKLRDKQIAKTKGYKVGKILLRWMRYHQTDASIWARMKKQAIERAMGIG